MSAGCAYGRLGARELRARAAALEDMQSPCQLCPRRCGALRREGERGFCGIAARAVVASWGLHFGEEAVLVGGGGSGTIFLAGCNLGCVFCQNYTISHLREGREADSDELAVIMLRLQAQGAVNINWVTPTHVVPQLVRGLAAAMERGLSVPLVYNCGGYESHEALELLDGIVDIYLPDAKFADAGVSVLLCGVDDYFSRASQAIGIMHRQVGRLQVDECGVARRGVLIRHLVMPRGHAGSDTWAAALRRLTGGEVWVNVMGQYHPEYQARGAEPIARRVTSDEVRRARLAFENAGVHLVE